MKYEWELSKGSVEDFRVLNCQMGFGVWGLGFGVWGLGFGDRKSVV